jgi:tRNA 2-thiouridine synthesizing protein A
VIRSVSTHDAKTRSEERVTPTDPVLVDARGHRCPVPTLRLRRALEQAAGGSRVMLLADDPMARVDVPHFVRDQGHKLVETAEDGPALRFTVEKRPASAAG